VEGFPLVETMIPEGRAVLVISNHGDIIGGGEISLLALLEGLPRTRWLPTVVVPSDGVVASRCHALGICTVIIPLPTLRRPGFAIPRNVLALTRLVRESGATLLHANGSRAAFYASLAGRLSRRPSIWHVRVADRDPWLDRILVYLADSLIVNSEAVASRFRWAPHGKVHRIYNGVDVKRFSPRPPSLHLRRALSLPEDALVVGSVGRFVPFKGYASLIDAARQVQNSKPGVHWVLVGEGPLRGELESQNLSLGMKSQVHFTGWRDDVPDILALCDLFVLPSLGEHFGRVLIEAMAMGKPMVATDAGGVPEIVIPDETGLLVPPGQPEALAAAVLSLLRDPERAARLGEAGRRRAEGVFSLERHVDGVEHVYQNLLQKSGGCR
jgi:glycosyltransferase involved in cell wall biosynthesis